MRQEVRIGEDGARWGYAIERGKVHDLAYKGPYVETEDDLVLLSRWLSGDKRIEGKRFFAIYSKHGFSMVFMKEKPGKKLLRPCTMMQGAILRKKTPAMPDGL